MLKTVSSKEGYGRSFTQKSTLLKITSYRWGWVYTRSRYGLKVFSSPVVNTCKQNLNQERNFDKPKKGKMQPSPLFPFHFEFQILSC